MGQYRAPGPEPQDPYNSVESHHRPDPQQWQPTYVSQQSYPPQPYQQPYPNPTAGNQGRQVEIANSSKAGGQIRSTLIQFLGKRGLVVAGGSLLAIITFFILPYYSNYSGYFLAAETLDDKWWLELILPVTALCLLLGQRLIVRMREQRRPWSLLIACSGLIGLLANYWFINALISSNYWRLGTWSYFLSMILVAVGGLLLSI